MARTIQTSAWLYRLGGGQAAQHRPGPPPSLGHRSVPGSQNLDIGERPVTGPQVTSGHRSLAWALRMRAGDRTLTDVEVLAARDAAVVEAGRRTGAVLRSLAAAPTAAATAAASDPLTV